MNNLHKNRDWLREQYLALGRTIKSISEECGVSHQTIEKYLRKFNIRKYEAASLPSPKDLISLHITKGYGIRKIAKMYPGVGDSTILRLMAESEINVL